VLDILLLGIILLGTQAGLARADGDWRFGPGIAIGVPHPFQFQLEMRVPSPRWSFGLALGYLPLNFQVGSRNTPLDLSIGNFELATRWHPWKGVFYLGANFGRRTIRATVRETIAVESIGVPVRIDGEVRGNYFTPHLGWLWTFDSGLFIGLNLGLQFGYGGASSLDVTIEEPLLNTLLTLVEQTAVYRELEDKVEDSVSKIGNINLPYITLFQIGFLF
jgi:hypothetical protein